ncbi:MAG TPA: DUF4160 domain-containing protein [Thermoanaerobaculia bacterium]|nr:DUF4160 domain-containing protein [Thermoanaerobaculia bacterium]
MGEILAHVSRHALIARFRFYSSDLFEPPHVHVLRAESEAKIWLQPVVVEYNHGYNQPELNHIVKLTRQNQDRLLEAWNAHFTQ